MKKLFFIILALSILISPSLVFARGESMRGDERVLLAEDEIISTDYFAAGETVTVSGTVLGDAYVAGGTVTVDGTIEGDLLVAGGTLNLRGDIKGDVRAAGGTVIVSGTIGHNLTVFGGTVELADTAVLAGSLVGGAGTLDVFAPVGKWMTVGVGTLTVDAPIGGDLTYWSEGELSQTSEASIAGQVVYHQVKENPENRGHAKAAMMGLGSAFSLVTLIGSFILGLIVLKHAPKYGRGVTAVVQEKPWLALFVGFAAVILTPVILVILTVTVIGIPLAFVLLLLFMLACTFAKIFTALFVGTRIVKYATESDRPYLALFLGLVVLMLLFFIPILGWILGTVLYLMGFGGLLLYKREFFDMLQAKKAIKS